MTAPRKLIVIGGGGHARLVIDAARSRRGEWDVVGLVDPEAGGDSAARLGVQHFKSDADAHQHSADAWFVMGIGRLGTEGLRRQIVARYAQHGARWARVIHATASVSPTASLAEGAIVLAGAVVNPSAVIGAHSAVNSGAVIEHDVKIGEFVFVAPGAIIGGGVQIGDDCFLGLGCRVRDNICIGRGAVIGMGAVVTKSVADGMKMLGVPARAMTELHADGP
jgi:acetyltransferase EpsM